MLAALDSRAFDGTAGKRYDLCGPQEYTLRELVEFVCAITGRRRLVIGLPDALVLPAGLGDGIAAGAAADARQLLSMQVPSVCDCAFPVRHPAGGAGGLRRPPGSRPPGPRERYPQLRWRAKR